MLSLAIFYYFLISLVIFTCWLPVFIGDSTTEKTDVISWLTLIIGASLWPLVLPLAYLELYNRMSGQKS